jgi:hypothetical protein
MTRHSIYTPELADEICERVATGEPLAQVCRDDHMPAVRTVYDWIERDTELSARFARARVAGFDCIADQALEIADDVSEDPASRRVRTDVRLKLLAKWDPKRYGDRMNLAGVDDSPLTVVVQKLTEEPK